MRHQHRVFSCQPFANLVFEGSLLRRCQLCALGVVQELSYAEISEALDIPEGTAMSHVHRTRNLLKQRLSRELPNHREPASGKNGTNGHARLRLIDATVRDGRSTVDAETRR